MQARTSLTFALLAAMAVGCGGSVRTQGDAGQAGSGGEAATGDVGSDAGAAGKGGSGGSSAGAGSSSAGGGAGGAGGASDQPVRLGPGSWDVTGAVKVLSSTSNILMFACDSVSFTLDATKSPKGYQLIMGRDGRMTGADLHIVDDAYLTGAVTFPVPSGCNASLLSAPSLELHGLDENGDGTADSISGIVDADATVVQGDVGQQMKVRIAFSGVPDSTPPTFVVPGKVNPLQAPSVSASEPLALGATLALVGETMLPLTAAPADNGLSAAIRFDIAPILPLSGSWQVQGTALDFVGHAFQKAGPLSTLDDPGVFPQDGFEADLVGAILVPGVGFVKSIGNVPAISGARSLFISPGGSLLLHLKRAAAEKSVHLALRVFSQYGTPSFFGDIRAGVVGGTNVVTPLIAELGAATDTGDAMWKQASPLQQVTIPILEAGTDVLLNLSSLYCGGGPCPPGGGFLIDDVKLQ